MPINIRPIPPKPGFLSRSLTGLGNFAKFYKSAIIDPVLDVAATPLPGVKKLQDVVDEPRYDMNEPETVFGYELPVSKAQSRGFQAGLLGNLNYGSVVPALSALKNAAGIARGSEVLNAANAGLDYLGIASGAADVGEGAYKGDLGQVARGVVTGGLSGVSRGIANHEPPPTTGEFWTKHSQQAPERPVETPLERIRRERDDQALADLFSDEEPVSRGAVAARAAQTPAPAFAPSKPKPGQATLQPANDAPVAPATGPDVPLAEKVRQMRLKSPRVQDAGIIPQARPGVGDIEDTTALDRYFETGDDPLAVPIDEPAPVVNNASGESGASVEALNRDTSMRNAGQQFVVRRGNELTPLIGPDAVDYRVRPGEEYGILHADGTFEVRDRGQGAPTAPIQPRSTAPDVATDPDVFDLGEMGGEPAPVAPDAAPPRQTPQQYMLGWLADDLESLPGEPLQKGQTAATRRRAYDEQGVLTPEERHALVHQPVRVAGTPTYQLLDNIPGLKGKNYAAKAQYLRRVMSGEIENPALIEAVDALRSQFDPNTHAFRPGTGPSPMTPPPGDTPADVLRAMFGDEEAARMMRERPPQNGPGYTRSHRLVGKARRDAAMEQAERGGSTDFDVVDEIAGAPPVDPERRKVLQGFAKDADVHLMDMIAGRRAARPPVVDTLPTGEAQPRLPGDVGDVRAAEVETPRLAAPSEDTFGLTPPPVKAPEQPMLAQSLPEDVPTLAPEPKVAPQAPALPKPTVPPNVRDYLVRQLKYTPEAVAAMTPEQAIAIGKARTPPEGATAASPPIPAAAAPSAASIMQDVSLPSTRNVPIRGKKPVSVRPVAEGGALAGKATPVEAEPAALAAAAQRVPETTPAAPQSAREKGTNPRAVEKATDAGRRFVETGDESALNSWAAAVANEAEQAGRGAVKAGHKVSLDGAPKISSNPMFDPDMWKTVGKVLVKTPAGRFYMGAVGGALLGQDQDDPWSETAKHALMGGLIASGLNKNTAREVFGAVQRMRTGQGLFGERGVRPVLPEAGEKWSAWDMVRSPQRSIPDVMRKVQPKFEVAEQAIRGFDPTGQPIKDFKSNLTHEEQKLAVKESLKDVRATLRAEGKRLWDSGEREKARLVREMLARVENRPTLFAQLFGGGPKARQADAVLAKVQYFQSLAWNLGLGKILNPTQKYFALNYVPVSAISKAKKLAKTPEGRARTDFLHVERASDDPDSLDLTFLENLSGDKMTQAKTLWSRLMEKTGGNALRGSDEMNRRVVYLAASDYAKAKGGVQAGKGFDASPEAIHRWAMDVVGQTQSVVGPMGQSPYVSRIGKAATTFTKFSTLALELALDAVQNPRPETLGLAAVAASMAMANKALPDEYELDLMKMFAPRAMTSLPAAGQVTNALSQATNKNQGVGERIVRTLAPDAPERYYDELFGEGGFLDAGMGTHRHPNRYGSLDEHSGYDALARLLGIETQANSDRILESQRQRKFQTRTKDASAAASAPKRQADKRARLLRSKPGEAAKDDIRRQVPVKARKDYDDRFGR